MGNLATPLSAAKTPHVNTPPKPTGRILVVEDDPAVQKALRRLFETEGYAVETQSDGRAALDSFQVSAPAAVVLDLRLPKISGRDVCKEIKATAPALPIVVLSAASDVSDKVLLLELGADDYVTKPFSPRELLARIRTILRRGTKIQPTALRVADLEIDLVQHRAVRGGKKLDLTPKEFALLSLLVRRRGEVLTRTVIADQVWDLNFDSHTNVVDVHMRRLRSKVDEGFEPKLIQTVRGVGYVVEGPAGAEAGA